MKDVGMDYIALKGIKLSTRIGVPETERAVPQVLKVDIELFSPVGKIAESDSVSQGIDYAAVTAAVESLATTERKTIERLAEDIATLLLEKFRPEGGVKISVWKKPADLNIDSACITITRP